MRDPQLAVSYSGPEKGKGAQIQWTSKVQSVGTGSMEITESEPNRHIDLAVNFNGLDGTSSYDVSPSGSGSKVTWAFGYDSGSSPLKRWKALMLDGFVGAEYRAGLDRLKEKIEVGTAPDRADHQRDPGRRNIVCSPSSLPRRFRPAPSRSRGAWRPASPHLRPEAAPAAARQTGSTTAPAAAEATPTPAPAPKPPKKKRRNRRAQ